MLQKLVELLPDTLRGESASTRTKTQVVSAIFEYLPLGLFSGAEFGRRHRSGQPVSTHNVESELNSTSMLSGPTSAESNYLCLVICTSVALELWTFADFQHCRRFYKLPETGLRMARYLPLRPLPLGTCSSYTPSAGNLKEYLKSNIPIFAISKPTEDYSPALGIHLFSLQAAQYFHVLRFASPLEHFVVSQHALVAALQGGELRVFDMGTLELRTTIQTLQMSESMKALLNEQTTQASELLHVWQQLVPVCDITDHLLAHVQHDIVSQSRYLEIARGLLRIPLLNDSTLAQQATRRLLAFGQSGYQKVMNLFHTRQATRLVRDLSEPEGLAFAADSTQTKAGRLAASNVEEDVLAYESDEAVETVQQTATGSDSEPATDKAASKGLRSVTVLAAVSANDKVDDKGKGEHENENEEEGFVDLANEAPQAKKEAPAKHNKVSIVVKRLVDCATLATMVPPYFDGISQLKFSPSGNLLIVANESGQHFYVYKFFPETNLRHRLLPGTPQSRPALLVYSIFRGYTTATVSSLTFSLCENWLIINSAKGTSHIYRLETMAKQQQEPPTQNSSAYQTSQSDHWGGVVSLQAFSRFKYASLLEHEELWPVTAILNHYPLSLLGSKREVLLRLGAHFYQTEENCEDEDRATIPLLVTITNKGEVTTNALLLTKHNAATTKSNPTAGCSHPATVQDPEEELVVENVGKLELALAQKADKIEDYLGHSIIPRSSVHTISHVHLAKSLVYTDHSHTLSNPDSAPPLQTPPKPDLSTQLKQRQQKWLKELITVSCVGTASIPTFTPCLLKTAHPPTVPKPHTAASSSESKTKFESQSEGSLLYQQLLVSESLYEPLEKMRKTGGTHAEATGEANDDMYTEAAKLLNDYERVLGKELVENPFGDSSDDQGAECEHQPTQPFKETNEPEQQSQIFQQAINVVEDYHPLDGAVLDQSSPDESHQSS